MYLKNKSKRQTILIQRFANLLLRIKYEQKKKTRKFLIECKIMGQINGGN